METGEERRGWVGVWGFGCLGGGSGSEGRIRREWVIGVGWGRRLAVG